MPSFSFMLLGIVLHVQLIAAFDSFYYPFLSYNNTLNRNRVKIKKNGKRSLFRLWMSAVRQGQVDVRSDAQVPHGRVTVPALRLHKDLRTLPRYLGVRRRNAAGDQLWRSETHQHSGEETRHWLLLCWDRSCHSAGRLCPYSTAYYIWLTTYRKLIDVLM